MPDLPTLWVPYVWVISAVFLLIGVVIAISWGFRSGQFDEDIKHQMFEDLDDDMYLSEHEQELAMRRKKIAREGRLKAEAEEAETEAKAQSEAGDGEGGASK
ncbi:MAG: hypothetical protein ACE5FN_02165 [Leptospirillia bacterium]